MMVLLRQLQEAELVEAAKVSTQKEPVSWWTHCRAMYPFPIESRSAHLFPKMPPSPLGGNTHSRHPKGRAWHYRTGGEEVYASLRRLQGV